MYLADFPKNEAVAIESSFLTAHAGLTLVSGPLVKENEDAGYESDSDLIHALRVRAGSGQTTRINCADLFAISIIDFCLSLLLITSNALRKRRCHCLFLHEDFFTCGNGNDMYCANGSVP